MDLVLQLQLILWRLIIVTDKSKLEQNMADLMRLSQNSPSIKEEIKKGELLPIEGKEENDIESDYDYARDNLRAIIDTSLDSLANLSDICRESDSPRAYEVLSTLLKTIADTNKDLLAIQKTARELREETPKNNPQHVTNALYIGTTTEFHKLLNKAKNEEENGKD